MLIQTTTSDVTKIVYDGVEYAVKDGYALVSVEAGTHLTVFPEWSVVTEEVDKKIINALEKAKPKEQTPVEQLTGDADSGEVTDPQDDGTDTQVAE